MENGAIEVSVGYCVHLAVYAWAHARRWYVSPMWDSMLFPGVTSLTCAHVPGPPPHSACNIEKAGNGLGTRLHISNTKSLYIYTR